MNAAPAGPARGYAVAVLSLLVLGPGALRAQGTLPSSGAGARSVVGVVVQEDGTTVGGALVLLGGSREMRTDEAGRFYFANVAPGRLHIAAVGDGCDVAEGWFTLEPERDKRIQLVLMAPGVRPEAPERSRAAATRSLEGWALERRGDLWLSELLDSEGWLESDGANVYPHGRGRAQTRVPALLVLDGIPVQHAVANVLGALRVNDVLRVELLTGVTAAWELGSVPAGAVLVVTTHASAEGGQDRLLESCLSRR